MNLMSIQYQDQNIDLMIDPEQQQQKLLINGEVILQQPHHYWSGSVELNDDEPRPFDQIDYLINPETMKVSLQLSNEGSVVDEHHVAIEAVALPQSKGANTGSVVAWGGLVFKLFKSVKVIQVVMLGLSAAAWSVLLSWQFAIALIGIMVFHEYGHLWAMKRSGLKTKGMYLIPFVGGIALGERAKTHWQDVFIALMGPSFGLLMTVVFYVLYLFTGNHFAGLVASIGALVNLFNLLPILPLDGGHAFQSLAQSGNRKLGFYLVLALSISGLGLALLLKLGLLAFFIILGFLDLMAARSQSRLDPRPTLDRYGILFSLTWYVLVFVALVAIILALAGTGLPGTELADAVLRS